jgi:fucose 4-O-acetylase-like acetyltransferase
MVKREAYVDIMKGWAMLIIIIFHCNQACFTGYAGELLGRPWAVAAFFIVAGFFLKEDALEKPVSFIKGKLRRLYIPATVIYALFILLHNTFVRIGWYPLGDMHPFSGEPYILYGWKETGVGLAKVLMAGGSGELAMGAMWFIYTLLYAFVAMALVYWLFCLICGDADKRFYWMTAVMLSVAAVSCVLSRKYGFTISRFSVAATAMWLIWWGMIVNKKWHWGFDKWWGVAISVLLLVHCVLLQNVEITLALNKYQDVLTLTAGTTAAIYIVGFIGKKIENTIAGRFFALMGRESLYLMAFHIVGFFICNSLLSRLGVFPMDAERTLYTYAIGNNLLILFVYTVFAVATPFAILFLYRGVKKIALRIVGCERTGSDK